MQGVKLKHSRASKVQTMRRVDEVLRIRLDGAEFWDLCEYVREQERRPGSAWELKPGRKPLSASQIWRYLGRADAIIAEHCRTSRKRRLRMHLAQRRNLFAKAVNSGDLRTALAVLADLAKLEGLYPSNDADLLAQVRELEARLRALGRAAEGCRKE